MNKTIWIQLLTSMVVVLLLIGCATAVTPQAEDVVTFSSNALAEDTGVTISFQHPREWQTSYFSDSGSSGWLVSNADPNEAFWSALSTGEEIVLLIMPVYDQTYLRDFPATVEPVKLKSNGRTIQFAISDGEIQGHVIKDEIAFEIFGYLPSDKESASRDDIETIFATFSWEALGNTDLSDVWLFGTRTEGAIELSSKINGYVPLASSSEWIYAGEAGQTVNLTINTHDPDVMLVLDILDASNQSILRAGPQDFSDSINLTGIELKTNGVYRIQLSAPTGFIKFGPWNPPWEAKVYGWYELSIE